MILSTQVIVIKSFAKAYNYLGEVRRQSVCSNEIAILDSFAAELPTEIFMAEICRIGTMLLAKYISIQRLYA